MSGDQWPFRSVGLLLAIVTSVLVVVMARCRSDAHGIVSAWKDSWARTMADLIGLAAARYGGKPALEILQRRLEQGEISIEGL